MWRALSVGLVVVLATQAHADNRCSKDQWCDVSSDSLSVTSLTRDPTKGTVIGMSEQGELFAYDGTALVPMTDAPPAGEADYIAYSAVASAGGVVVATRYNPTEDTSDPVTSELVTNVKGKWVVRKSMKQFTFNAVVAVSATQGWAVGSGDVKKNVDDPTDERAVIVRWDGKKTQEFRPKGVKRISDIVAVDATEAYFTARQGLGRVDAKGKVTWLPVPEAAKGNIGDPYYFRLHRAGPDDLYVLGGAGLIHYEKNSPTIVKLPTIDYAPSLVAIETTSPNDVTVLDEHGKTFHFDGHGWMVEEVGQGSMHDIVRTGDGSLLIVADHLIRHAPR